MAVERQARVPAVDRRAVRLFDVLQAMVPLREDDDTIAVLVQQVAGQEGAEVKLLEPGEQGLRVGPLHAGEVARRDGPVNADSPGVIILLISTLDLS